MDDFQIGKVHTLLVDQRVEDGFILRHGETKVFLPEKEITQSVEEGSKLDVFLYRDRQDKLTASMRYPDATVESYGWAEVVEIVRNLGAFVNIGVNKEILVSLDDLPALERVWPQPGDWLFVALELDKKGKLFAKPITEGDIRQDLEKAPESALNKPVTGRVYRSTKAGSFILTEEGYRGFIHPTEWKKEPRLGETVEGRIIAVKEDGTVNVSLLPLKKESMQEDADVILEYLKRHDGVMPFSDKSDPETIRETFSISKAAFKRALGKLMKEKKVIQENGKSFLKQTEEE